MKRIMMFLLLYVMSSCSVLGNSFAGNNSSNHVKVDYLVSYHSGGGEGTPPESVLKNYGDTIELPNNDFFEREGFIFIGWNVNGEHYDAEDEYEIPTEDVNITARWLFDDSDFTQAKLIGMLNTSLTNLANAPYVQTYFINNLEEDEHLDDKKELIMAKQKYISSDDKVRYNFADFRHHKRYRLFSSNSDMKGFDDVNMYLKQSDGTFNWQTKDWVGANYMIGTGYILEVNYHKAVTKYWQGFKATNNFTDNIWPFNAIYFDYYTHENNLAIVVIYEYQISGRNEIVVVEYYLDKDFYAFDQIDISYMEGTYADYFKDDGEDFRLEDLENYDDEEFNEDDFDDEDNFRGESYFFTYDDVFPIYNSTTKKFELQ